MDKLSVNKGKKKSVIKTDKLATTKRVEDANFLERILAIPQGIFGQIPDLIYGASEGDNLIQRFLGNIGEGIETTVSGKRKLDLKSSSDLLKKLKILDGDDAISNILRTGIGFAGDVLLDPTTYMSGGTGAITKLDKVGDVAKLLDKTTDTAKVLDKVGDTSKLTNRAEDLVEAGAKLVNKKTGEIVEKVLPKAEKYLDISIPFTPKVRIKGKGAEILDAMQNPLGYGLSKAGVATKKVAPKFAEQAEFSFNEFFRKGKNAEKAGLSEVVDKLKSTQDSLESADRLTDFNYGKLVNDLKKLPDDIRDNLEDYLYKQKEIPLEYKPIVEDFGKAMLEARGKVESMNLFKKPGVLNDLDGEITDLANSSKYGGELKDKIMSRVEELKRKISSVDNLEDKLRLEALLSNLQENTTKLLDQNPNFGDFMKFVRKEKRGDIGGVLNSKQITDQLPLQAEDTLSSKLFQSGTENFYVPRKVVGVTHDYIKTGKLYENLPNEMKKAIADFGLQPQSVNEILAGNERIIRAIKKEGSVKSDILSDILQKDILNYTDKQILDLGLKPRDLLQGNIEKRLFDTQEIGKQAGIIYDKDLSSVTKDYLTRVEKAKSLDTYIKSVENLTDDMGNKVSYTTKDIANGLKPPADFKEISDIPELGSVFVPKQIYPEMNSFFNDFIKAKDKSGMLQKVIDINKEFLSIWKPSVTGKGPGFIGFHIRNAIGDMNNMILGGFRNKDGALKKGFSAVNFEQYAKKEGVEKAIEKFGEESGDLYKKAIDYGIISKKFQSEEKLPFSYIGGDKYKKVKKVYNDITDKVFLTETLGKREEAFRVANFYDAFKRTGDWKEASKIAKRSSLDYSNLTGFEKGVAQAVPFYNFMRQNLEHQLTTFATNPKALLIQQDLFDNISKNLGGNLSEEDYAALPDWMKQGLTVVMKNNGGEEDRNVSVLTGFGTPTHAINEMDLLNPVKFIESMAGKLSLPLKVPMELASGQDFFTNKPISDNTFGERYKDAPQFVKDFLEFKEVKTEKKGKTVTEYFVNPQKKYLFNNMPFLQTYVTQAKRVNEAMDDPKMLINLLSGGRIYEKDLEVEAQRRARGL